MPSWVSAYKWLIITLAALAIAALVAIGWHSIFKGGEAVATAKQASAQINLNQKVHNDQIKIDRSLPRGDRVVKLDWLRRYTGPGQ